MPTSEFWTTKQADDAVSGFLRTDVKLGNPAESSDGLQENHDLYLKLTELLASAADDDQNGIANGDSSLLEAGDSKYVQARLRRILVESALAAAGSD